MSFVCLLSFVFTHQIEQSECRVWFQWFTQWWRSCVSNLVGCWREEREKSELLMEAFCVSSFFFTTQTEFSECCVWFQCFTQWCCSCVSNVVLCWCEEKEKSELLMDVFCLSSFFCLHHSDWVEWVLCLISMIHSVMLLLCLQSCSLFTKWETRRVYCWWRSFVCLLSLVFTTQIERSECCVRF